MDDATSVEQLREAGYCVIADVVPAGWCAQIRRQLLEVVARVRQAYGGAPRNVGFVPSVINHDQSFAEYLAEPRLLTVIRQLLGPHLRISFTSAIINEPGNARGEWHADWPFNQRNAGHVAAPYADVAMHVTTLWMLSPFASENGGTLIAPGSHRSPTNPTDRHSGLDPHAVLPEEKNATGGAGSVLVMDSRLWHATAPNSTDEPRVALAVRYAPWWLNLGPLRPESDARQQLCEETGLGENVVPPIRRDVYERLPADVQPLYRHWVEPDAPV